MSDKSSYRITEEEAMSLVKSMVDTNRINYRLGLIPDDNLLFEAMEIVYNRAACNIGLKQIMSAKTDEGDNDE